MMRFRGGQGSPWPQKQCTNWLFCKIIYIYFKLTPFENGSQSMPSVVVKIYFRIIICEIRFKKTFISQIK